MRADLTGDGQREYITMIDAGTDERGFGVQNVRVCSGSKLWETEASNISLLTVLKVGDQWFLAWGGTSGRGRHQRLSAIVGDDLTEVLDDRGELVRLDEGEYEVGFGLTKWWGCENDRLAIAERETGTNLWTITHLEWEPETGQMIAGSMDRRDAGADHNPNSTWDTEMVRLSDVLPPPCEGDQADGSGPGLVPRGR